MKKNLVIASLVLGGLGANAASVSFSTIITVGSNQVGAGTGKFNPASDKIILSGTFTSASTIASGSFSGPGITTPLAFSISPNGTVGGVPSWYFHFVSPQSVPSTFINNASSYIASFFTAGSSTPVAGGPAIASGLTVVPEPQTYAMMAGAALMGFAAFRRARR